MGSPGGETSAAAVSGRALPPFEQPAGDPAIGAVAPLVTGGDLLTAEPVTIEAAGRPLAIGFFAHWCPHCQREVDEITEWLAAGNQFPAGVDFMTVSTFEDATRGNHPPAAWLSNKGWPFPVVADTDGFAAAEAFGVASIPFFVFIDADGVVIGRLSGNVGPEALAEIFGSIGEGAA